jgi:hypothetical protein
VAQIRRTRRSCSSPSTGFRGPAIDTILAEFQVLS